MSLFTRQLRDRHEKADVICLRRWTQASLNLSPSAKAKQDRNLGAQPGHSGSKRVLRLAELFATQCENRSASLPKTPDASPARYRRLS
jgi:hypothetical protein